MKHLLILILLGSILVACPGKPKVKVNQDGGTTQLEPHVQFVGPPSKNSTETSISVEVKASNNATKQYAYAFIAGTGDCNTQTYGTWSKFNIPIVLNATQLGSPGKKTLCAKGKTTDDEEQKVPTQYEWTLVNTELAPKPEPTPSPTPSPNGGDGGGDTGGGDQSLEIDDAEEVVTSDGLQLSQNILKFASANKDTQDIDITNTSSNSLSWSTTTEHEAGLLEIRLIDTSQENVASKWKIINKTDMESIRSTLNSKSKQTLQVRLAYQWKTDYGDDKVVKINFSDGSNSAELTVHILAPQLEITADEDENITNEDSESHVWRVNLTPSAKEKILKVKNSKGDLDVLKWDVFPYAWKPNWFHYIKDEEAGTLTLQLKDDCKLYPAATADDELTFIIASNSDSAGVRARSFALFKFNANQELEWEEEKENETKETKSKKAEWHTTDIRYVVVKFTNEEGTSCP